MQQVGLWQDLSATARSISLSRAAKGHRGTWLPPGLLLLLGSLGAHATTCTAHLTTHCKRGSSVSARRLHTYALTSSAAFRWRMVSSCRRRAAPSASNPASWAAKLVPAAVSTRAQHRLSTLVAAILSSRSACASCKGAHLSKATYKHAETRPLA